MPSFTRISSRPRSLQRDVAACLLAVTASAPKPAAADWLKDLYDIGIDLWCRLNDCRVEEPRTEPLARGEAETQAQRIVGYLVFLGPARIENSGELRPDDRVCGPAAAIEKARSHADLRTTRLTVLPAAEIYGAMETGICDVAFYPARDTADQLFPVTTTWATLVPVFETH